MHSESKRQNFFLEVSDVVNSEVEDRRVTLIFNLFN